MPAQRSRQSDTQADIFHFEIILDSVVAALAAESGLLDPSEGRDLGRDDAGIDPYDPVFQRLGHLVDAAEIACIEIARETEYRVIGKINDLILVLELEERRERSEGFLGCKIHVAGRAGYDRGRQEQPVG